MQSAKPTGERFPAEVQSEGSLPQDSGSERTPPMAGAQTSIPTEAWHPPLANPQKIARFEIRQRLGRGGFGTVFLAHDPELGRDVAIKLLSEGRDWSDADKTAFIEEARTAARLNHPHVVTIYDVGRCEEHGVFIAMEYVAGEPLSQRLRRGKLQMHDAIRICGQVADAVGYFHNLRLYHRDLKPANVLLDQDGNAKVCDFGLALGEHALRSRRGDTSGTRPYMSPEQLRGDCHQLDGRSDLWSLGIILYECLSGRTPFQGETLEEIREDISTRDPTPLTQFDEAIPEALDGLFRRCTQRDVSQRLRTASEFKQALAQLDRPGRRAMPIGGVLIASAAIIVLLALATLAIRSQFLGPAENAVALVTVPHDKTKDAQIASPATRGPVDLLAKSPRAVVFDFSEEKWHFSYMENTRRLIVYSPYWSLFACGDHSHDMQLDMACTFGERPAATGIFWGLHTEAAADGSTQSACLAVIVDPPNSITGQVAHVRLYRLAISPDRFGGYSIGSHEFDRMPIDLQWDRPMTIQIRVEQGRLNQLLVQGQTVTDMADNISPDWENFVTGECGVSSALQQATFTRMLRHPLSPGASK